MDWRKGKWGVGGAGGGGEDGVPEPPTGVPADPTGQPRLHHRLRPHHRRCGEQLQRQLLMSCTGYPRVLGKLGFGPRGSSEGLVSRVGGGVQGSLWGSESPRKCYPVIQKKGCCSMRGGGSGLRVSFGDIKTGRICTKSGLREPPTQETCLRTLRVFSDPQNDTF